MQLGLPALWAYVWLQSSNYVQFMARPGKLQWQLFAEQVYMGEPTTQTHPCCEQAGIKKNEK